MQKTIQQYEARAEECVRLANLTADETVCAELLKLRQAYLAAAARLRKMLNQPKAT
jgi:outer membrane protein assembly factor BamD (BamD/ComL family)